MNIYRTMTLKIFLISFISLLLLLPSSLLYGQDIKSDTAFDIPLSKRYDEAKFYYNQLQTNKKTGGSRENWLKGTRNFRRIYLSSPKSELAPACLFMLGRLYGDMYNLFRKPGDLEESESYFKDIVRLFPGHRLADDAYFSLGRLYINKKNDPIKAAEFFEDIITHYQSGDMHPKAENQLKILSKEHNIALPKSMMSSSSYNNKLSYVLPVKYWSSDSYTRVVIMASGPVNYQDVLLEKTANNPTRLYIDFKKSYIEPKYRSPVPIEDGLLKRIRTGQFSPDTVRVVLDIESLSNYKIFSLPDPFRVVIDVRGEGFNGQKKSITSTPVKKKKNVQGTQNIVVLKDKKKISVQGGKRSTSSSKAQAIPRSEPLSLAQQLGLGVRKIVIDPGHGGKDPGAMAFGLKEKNIVLQIAKTLAPVLQKELGCEVILTRNSDTFVPLEERTAIANTESADLFVSLHVNAHPSAKVRGLETYYLNLSTNAEAMRVAAMENATSTHQMSDLQDILSDIMQNSKVEESSRLAQQVHNSILNEAEIKGYSDIKNLGVKQAPFYVLIGAEMPAILLEVAFITNETDARNLQDPIFIRMITQEIADGIKSYINSTSAQLHLQ
jgi:N-acetylmuramoyl-L-alanine amidase